MKRSIVMRWTAVCPAVIALGLVSAGRPAPAANGGVEPTRVLVVGTIHGNHETAAGYTFQDLLNILSTYAPDAVCVEIRPVDFRKKSYLREMMMASMFGLEHGLKVYPIDWWPAGDDRSKRAEFMKTPEYAAREKQEEAMIAADPLMQAFQKKYGDPDAIWKANTMGYEFYNGEDYNRYIEEMYKVSEAVYGDGPMNLSYKARNDEMMGLIRKALDENPGKRVVVLTGAEHKHYFDLALAAMAGVKVVRLADILPLKPAVMSPDIARLISDNLARGYFDESTREGVDTLYIAVMVPLLHGPGMDDDPSTIPPGNVAKAKPFLDEWQGKNPDSAYLQFERAWVEFLEGRCAPAVLRLEKLRARTDEIPEAERNFVKVMIDRNQGLCYDLLGERAKAVECYVRGEAVCRALGCSDRYIAHFYKNYKDVPYVRKSGR